MKITPQLAALLRDADPVASEAGLSADAVAEMRGVVVAAARHDERRTVSVRRILVLATAGALATVTTIAIVWRPEPVRLQPAPATVTAADPDRRTQLQYATPGGTRVIWTFDPSFQLKEARR